MRRLAFLSVLAAVLAVAQPVAGGPRYEVKDLGTLGRRFCGGFVGPNSFAMTINEGGQVGGGSCVMVGSRTPQPVTHGFFWTDGFLTDVGTPEPADDRSPDQSVINGMNDSGQLVGRNYISEEGGGAHSSGRTGRSRISVPSSAASARPSPPTTSRSSGCGAAAAMSRAGAPSSTTCAPAP
jgi:uncharacterized membrane protein